MKLTENVLKQTIREVISELLDEGKPEPAKSPKEADEWLKTVTDVAKEADKYPKENPTKTKKVAEPSKKKKKEIKEVIDEILGEKVNPPKTRQPKKSDKKKFDKKKHWTKKQTKTRPVAPTPEEIERARKEYEQSKTTTENLDELDIEEVSGVPVAEDEFDPIAASEALDKVALPMDDNEEDLGLEEQESLPSAKIPSTPPVKEVPAPEVKVELPKAPAGQQTKTSLSLKEQVSAKHNRIFKSLVKSIAK